MIFCRPCLHYSAWLRCLIPRSQLKRPLFILLKYNSGRHFKWRQCFPQVTSSQWRADKWTMTHSELLPWQVKSGLELLRVLWAAEVKRVHRSRVNCQNCAHARACKLCREMPEVTLQESRVVTLSLLLHHTANWAAVATVTAQQRRTPLMFRSCQLYILTFGVV